MVARKKKLEFFATREQVLALEGLAYWIADNSYIRERYGDHEPELINVDKSIHCCMDELDSLKVPFWVQNSTICYAENWRRYKEAYMDSYMKKLNIFL